jgi:hypothetical protein
MSASALQPDHSPESLRSRLHLLQRQLLDLGGPWHEPGRQAIWPDLAVVLSALGKPRDAAICWLNAMWEVDVPPPSWTAGWVIGELGKSPDEIRPEDVDRLLAIPSAEGLRPLLALVIWATSQPSIPHSFRDRGPAVTRQLRLYQEQLPVRAVWLGWVHLARLFPEQLSEIRSVREQLLSRLHRGLSPLMEWPACLHRAVPGSPDLAQDRRDQILRLHELAQAWVKREAPPDTPVYNKMGPYADLLFAYALARIGQVDASLDLQHRAETQWSSGDEVCQLLLKAFGYRIKQAQEGKPHTGPQPPDVMAALEQMNPTGRYAIDRLRQHSHILEPDQVIDPFRHWGHRLCDLDREVAELGDVVDGTEVASRVARLLGDLPRGPRRISTRVRILQAGLEVAPRVSENFARALLDQVPPAYDALLEIKDPEALWTQARFLERALMVAAHFDRIEHIHPLVARFEQLLEGQRGDVRIRALVSLAGQCFRGLRKLGMRDEINHLLTQMADLVLQGREVAAVDPRRVPDWPSSLQVLLHVAAGWYYIGHAGQGEQIIQASRKALFSDELCLRDKCALALTYVSTVIQASEEVAQARLEELFTRLCGTADTYTTNKYYYLFQYDLLEAVAQAVASNDYGLGSNIRQWLDDDELLVRRRIHREARILAASQSKT